MIHLGATPGAPRAIQKVDALYDAVCRDADIYARCGVDAVMLENMHDVPYTHNVGPEVVATMAVAAEKVRAVFDGPVGIQILASANREALAAALASGCRFIRVEGYVFGHLADEGYTDACAGALLRYRRQIGADHIHVFVDIKKKHSSHALTVDISLEETARAAAFFCADGVIVTGTETGRAPSPENVAAVREAVDLPVLVGSGITDENAQAYAPYTDAFIIGSHFKTDGRWEMPVDEQRVTHFMRMCTQKEQE